VSSPELAEPRSLPPGQRLTPELRAVSYGRVPHIDLATWSLRIGGDTQAREAVSLSWADLLSMPQIVVRSDHHCVSRNTALDLEWSGVAARAIVDLVPPADEVRHVLVSAARGYSSSIRIEDLSSPRAVFATHLDGDPLSPEHGWPLRLVLPHLYGWKGPKWVGALDYHRYAERGFWEQRGYHLTGDVWREERYAYQE
jgi:DMSO/TMAO reductase YedYZ molybdopterin-dependent catalytic subunit